VLKPGSLVMVIAPAGVHDAARLEAGIRLIEGWGLRVRRAPHLGDRHRYTAGTDADRAADLRAALLDPEVEAVWFSRGGFGTVHTLASVPWRRLDERPIIGFSDATALFSAGQRRGRGRFVHGPVLHSLADTPDAESVEALRALLFEGAPARLVGRHLCGPAAPVEGPVVGGNLCVLASLAGTRWAARNEGRILLLEDLGEPAYKLDRLLTQLQLSGALRGVVGVALGDFLHADPPADAGWTLDELFIDRLGPLGVPVLAGLPVGHASRNHAWMVGARGRLAGGVLRVG
jgi:muramoyltetrapeptide carboxypeptidase